jgi:NAD(P)-dependent dehydrogenase (short-subunit alcohol dehydrogenase family)
MRGTLLGAVCPGTIDTPMIAAMLAKEPHAMKDIMRDQPIGRLGRPEEIASAERSNMVEPSSAGMEPPVTTRTGLPQVWPSMQKKVWRAIV